MSGTKPATFSEEIQKLPRFLKIVLIDIDPETDDKLTDDLSQAENRLFKRRDHAQLTRPCA